MRVGYNTEFNISKKKKEKKELLPPEKYHKYTLMKSRAESTIKG